MKTKQQRLRSVLLIVLPCLLLLVVGIAGMQTLASMKTPPVRTSISEKPLKVQVLQPELESVTPFLTGFGEVKAVDVVPISAEIQGKVVQIHPQLEVGGLVNKSEMLIRIDASEEQITLKSNRKRLTAVERNLELAKNEFRRMDKLNKKKRLVTVSELEKAEQAYQSMFDAYSQLEQAIALSKLKIKLATITAPFNARVKSVLVKKDQFVSPGETIVTLVNDTRLEVIVSIDSEEAEKVLQFKPNSRTHNQFWFSELEQVPAMVSWSQGSSKSDMVGVLHRVVAFDPQNRTLKLAVRLTAKSDSKPSDFPIVEGMFCRVKIPGKTLQNVVKLPRQAVQYDKTVYVVTNNRLKTVPVEIGWIDDDIAYVASGLKQEDPVILTRLTNPLENTLVDINRQELIATNNGKEVR